MIHARALSKSFTMKEEVVEAVPGVDLEVDKGEMVALLGPKGAGKSTTLRMLTTLLEPTAGSATVAGYDIRTDPAGVRRHIGFMGMMLPLDLGPGWVVTLGRLNPLIYIVEAMRALFAGRIGDAVVLRGAIVALSLTVVGLLVGTRAMRHSNT